MSLTQVALMVAAGTLAAYLGMLIAGICGGAVRAYLPFRRNCSLRRCCNPREYGPS